MDNRFRGSPARPKTCQTQAFVPLRNPSSSRTQFVLLREGGIQRVRRRFGLPLELACKTPVGLCSPKDGIFFAKF